MKILLVEPNYKTRFPSIALMKLSAYQKSKGNEVEYVKGNVFLNYTPDMILITTLFTYEAAETIKCINFYNQLYTDTEVVVGGIFATFMPDYIQEKTGIKPFVGLLPDNIENIKLDYSLFPDYPDSLITTSRGCIRKCKFCAAPLHEPTFFVKEDWLEK
jgi:radical SAM superfamily enzyme YgiQ (UPF0313 family)